MTSKLLKTNEAWQLEQECRAGIKQTITIFRTCGLSDLEIAELFRAEADELDPPIKVAELDMSELN